MSATTTEVKKSPELKPHIVELSKKLAEVIKIDHKAGTAAIEADAYVKNMPEGVTKESTEAAEDYRKSFVAAGSHAFGMAAVEAMKKDKTSERYVLEAPMTGRDSVTFSLDRSKTSHNPREPEKEIVKAGYVSASMDLQSGKNGGQFKAVRVLVSEYAAKHIAGK